MAVKPADRTGPAPTQQSEILFKVCLLISRWWASVLSSPVREFELGHRDHLLGQILYSLNEDCHWYRDRSREPVQVLMANNSSNKDVISSWITNWRPRALLAVGAFGSPFESKPIGQGENLFTISLSRSTISGPNCLRALLLKEPDQRPDSRQFIHRFPLIFYGYEGYENSGESRSLCRLGRRQGWYRRRLSPYSLLPCT